MKKLFMVVMVLSLMTLSVLSGIYLQQNVLSSEEVKYETSLIAVVNTDQGVEKNGDSINYASSMILNEEGYKFTGLNDAKEGLENGTYAAYVIVPEDFSSSVESVNANPKTAQLSYEVSGDLSEAAKDKAITNLYALQESINYQSGYMYVTSILGEFHSGQNTTSKVIQSENKVLDAVNSINPSALTTMVEIPKSPELRLDEVVFNIDEEIANHESTTSNLITALESGKNSILNGFSNVVSQFNIFDNKVLEYETKVDSTVNGSTSKDEIDKSNSKVNTDVNQYLNKVATNHNGNQKQLWDDYYESLKDELSSTNSSSKVAAERTLEELYLLGAQDALDKYIPSHEIEAYTLGHKEGFISGAKYAYNKWYQGEYADTYKIAYREGMKDAKVTLQDVSMKYADFKIVDSSLSEAELKDAKEKFFTGDSSEIEQLLSQSRIALEAKDLKVEDYCPLNYVSSGKCVITVDQSEIKDPSNIVLPDDLKDNEIVVATPIPPTFEKVELDEDFKLLKEDIDKYNNKILDDQEIVKWVNEQTAPISTLDLTSEEHKNEINIPILKELTSFANNVQNSLSNVLKPNHADVNKAFEDFDMDSEVDVMTKNLEKEQTNYNKEMSNVSKKQREYQTALSKTVSENFDLAMKYSVDLNKTVVDHKMKQDEHIVSSVTNTQGAISQYITNNISNMNSFTMKLPYTRSGENQNSQVKNHILKQTETDFKFNSITLPQGENFSVIIPGAIALVLLIVGSVGIYMLRDKKKLEDELM